MPTPITPETIQTALKQREFKKQGAESGYGLISRKDNQIQFRYEDRLYTLRGMNLKSRDSLKAVITVEIEGGRHTDKLDLFIARSRKNFAESVSTAFDIEPARVGADLLQMCGKLEEIRDQESAEPENAPPYEMTEQERKEAVAFLKRADILERIVTDLDACGQVGEAMAKQLCYLSASSRITDTPHSVIIRSASASGKTSLMDRITELMPPESIEFFSRITSQSLYYMDRNRLKHKLVIIDERNGMEDADYSIRTLQSRNKLSLAVVARDPASGRPRTETITLNGPCAVWESTTRDTVNAENASRCFEVFLDESEDQTRRIHRAQKMKFTRRNWQRNTKKQAIIRTHRNAQRLLQPLKVDIPYADLITFPAEWLRTRRDHDRFLHLIAMVALLYQYQRDISTTRQAEPYIQATLEDYDIAYRLSGRVLKASLSHVSKNAQDLLYLIFDRFTDECFTRGELRQCNHWSESRTRRALNELESMEYVQRISGSQGRRCRYKLIITPANYQWHIEGLTTPEELRQIVNARPNA